MSNISNELFLLIANLSQQRNKEKIISLFIHGLNSHLEGGNFRWIKKPRIDAQIVVCTKNKIYGEISYSKYYFENNTINLALAQNGAQMLAVIIERLEQEELASKRTQELEEKNKELERFNQLFIGREFRIKELREEVKELEKKLAD